MAIKPANQEPTTLSMVAAILDFTHNAIRTLLLSFLRSTLVKFRTNILAIKKTQQKTSHVSHNKLNYKRFSTF